MHLFLCVNPNVHNEGKTILTGGWSGPGNKVNSDSCFKQIYFLGLFMRVWLQSLQKMLIHEFKKSSLKIQYGYQKRRIWCWFRKPLQKSTKKVWFCKRIGIMFFFHLLALYAKVLGPLTFSGYNLLQLFQQICNQNQNLRFLVPMLLFFSEPDSTRELWAEPSFKSSSYSCTNILTVER